MSDVYKAFESMYKLYLRHGFRIQVVTMRADGEFALLQAQINEVMPRGPEVSLASANEHVPEIERRIWVVKERVRAVRHCYHF